MKYLQKLPTIDKILDEEFQTKKKAKYVVGKRRNRLTTKGKGEGDKNTSFFHEQATNRIRINQIKGLEYNNGVWKDTKNEIEEIIVNYLKNLHISGPLQF